MSPPGRRPKPAVVKELHGNTAKIATADFQKQIARQAKGKGRPRAPRHLSDEARALWRDMVESLPVALLTRADEGVLERYAVAYERFRATQREIEATGLTIAGPNGTIKNPLLLVQKQATDEMHKASAEIGLTPAARARLLMDAEGDEDLMSKLLGGEIGDWAGSGGVQ